MATFKNVSGAPLDIPALDVRAGVGETFDIPDAEVAGLSSNPAVQQIKAKKTTTEGSN